MTRAARARVRTALGAALLAALVLPAGAEGPPAGGVPASEPAAALRALVGRWRSEDDPLAEVEVARAGDGFVWVDRYDGEVVGGEPVALVRTCDGLAATGLTGFLRVGAADPLCYDILASTPTRLELIYLGRGNVLRYRRAR